MSQQLATWIGPHIDSGERFAEQVCDDLEEPMTGWTFGVELDGEDIAFAEDYTAEGVFNRINAIKRVIAAAFEHGRELGRKESR
jgi:hypothetical protein